MVVRLHIVEAKAWPANLQGLLGAKAYTVFDQDGNADVNVKAPWHARLLGGVERTRHELEHARDRSFTNAGHHSALHACTRSYSPIRFGGATRDAVHAPFTSKADAQKLLRDGFLPA